MTPGFGPGGPGGGRMGKGPNNAVPKIPKPKSIKEVPGYVLKIMGDFFYRLFYIIKLVWDTSPLILVAMLTFSVVSGIIPVVQAFLGAELLNELAAALMQNSQRSFSPIMWLLVGQFAMIFLRSIISSVENIVTKTAGELVTNNIKTKIMAKAKGLDLADFDIPEFYEKLENASREAQNRPIHILQSTLGMITSVIAIGSFIAVLVALNPIAPFVVFLLAIPSGIVSFVYRRKSFRYVRGHSKERRQLSYYSDLMVNKDVVKEIKIYGLADTFAKRYKEIFKAYFNGLKKLFIGEGAWNMTFSLVSATVNCALFLYVAKGVYDGILQIGDYSLYTAALNNVSAGVSNFIRIIVTMYEGTLFIDNLIEFMKRKPKLVPVLKDPRIPQKGTPHTIEFKNVSFSYPGTERKVLDNISFTINSGESVVLVGINGAGKTTLIKLITRLYDPTDGVILLDGHDIREYDTKELYSLYGIIFQDFGKYAASVSENISFGNVNKEICSADVEYAADMSGADDFIGSLADGYNTPLTRIFEENGIELSVGQWQKLSVARAFYGGNDIIILDEPTASLDALAEQEIYSRFDELREGKTTIFVSHRLSSATSADKIVVIDGGKIAEMGNHRELMELDGVYCNLFTTQAKRYIESADEIKKHEENLHGAKGIASDSPENGHESEGGTNESQRI